MAAAVSESSKYLNSGIQIDLVSASCFPFSANHAPTFDDHSRRGHVGSASEGLMSCSINGKEVISWRFLPAEEPLQLHPNHMNVFFFFFSSVFLSCFAQKIARAIKLFLLFFSPSPQMTICCSFGHG